MDDQDYNRSGSRRLLFTRTDFDDYLIALNAKLRINAVADRILSGELRHPLIAYQQQHSIALQQLNVPFFPDVSLLQNPAQSYVNFLRVLTQNLLVAPAVPDVGDLNALQEAADIFRQGERFIYSTIVQTLKVGDSMHYARQCNFGAGQILLQTIINDNRQVTTRSLMAVFSALLSLSLHDNETFEQFSRRMELLIQRLQNWRPPVVLPEQLLLFCALRALPAVPYGPVRHIILASPHVGYLAGMGMLRDVANTGGELIANTLGSGSAAAKPAAILCATPCDDPGPAPRGRQRQRQRPQRPRQREHAKQPRYLVEGPCAHHGPNSKHATSECRDPGLTKRKKSKKPAPAASAAAAFTSTAEPSRQSQDVMFSEIFVASISKAATRFPRAKFTPARRVRSHLHRSHHKRRSPKFAVNNVSLELCDACISTYTNPIPGSFSSAPAMSTAVPIRVDRRRRSGRRKNHPASRKNRRLHRQRGNRRDNYPRGKFRPVRPRRSRPVDVYDPKRAVSRRQRRRKLTEERNFQRLADLLRSAGIEVQHPAVQPSSARPRSKPRRKPRHRRRSPCIHHKAKPRPRSSPSSRSASNRSSQSCPAPSVKNGGCPAGSRPRSNLANGSCPAPSPTCVNVPSSPPPPPCTACPELAQGTVVVEPNALARPAHLYFAIDSKESCITTAALPPNVELVPRDSPPNTPVFVLGLTSHDLRHVGALRGTFSHYAIVDLDVTVVTVDHPTLLSSVPVRVIRSDFPAVLLGTNDIVNWHVKPRPSGAHIDHDAENVRPDCLNLLRSLLTNRVVPPPVCLQRHPQRCGPTCS